MIYKPGPEDEKEVSMEIVVEPSSLHYVGPLEISARAAVESLYEFRHSSCMQCPNLRYRLSSHFLSQGFC